MQFPKDEQEVKRFREMLGEARFSRYLTAAEGDEKRALSLYIWNTEAAQAFYLPLQIWEICLRNQINRFMCWKFGGAWPYDDKRAVRQLQGEDRNRLLQARERQQRERKVMQASTDAIAADLSAGFWVSLLARRYADHLVWRYNLQKVFPHSLPSWREQTGGMNAMFAHALCEEVLKLRNRVAHHEPIFGMDLHGLHFKVAVLVGAMCHASFAYLESHCTVHEILSKKSM